MFNKQKLFSLYKKELAFYFNNPIGFIVVILFAALSNFLFIKDIFIRGNGSMRPFFDLTAWIMVIFIPAVSMRVFAEEKRTNTIEVLLTLPVSEAEIVLSKFLAASTVVGVALFFTLSLPITVAHISQISLSETVVSYIGLMMLASSFTAIGMFFSLLSVNQIVAFLSGAATLFLFYAFGTDMAASWLPQFVREATVFLSPANQYETFLKGLLDMRSILYFLSLTAVFLFLNFIILRRRD